MVTLVEGLSLAGPALGAVGSLLVFVEFMQVPSYVEYRAEFDSYDIDVAPGELREHTWLGRAGGLMIAVGFAMLFLAELL